MNGMCTVVVAAVLAATGVAQRGVSADEFVRLEPIVQAAIAKAAPFTVTIETFGGTRRASGKEGDFDGDAPPLPRESPKEPPKEPSKPTEPDGEPKPDEGEKKGEGEKEGKQDDKPKKPLVAEGFKQALGRTTGVVLNSDGCIVVSRSALNLDPSTVLVTVPGRDTFRAVRAGEDTSRGIALVKIAATGLPVPELMAPEQVQVGQCAHALGRTFAVDEPSVHLGIVSAKQRLFGRALQIATCTSPANYGGLVVDLQGRLLGIAVPLSPSGRNSGVEWYDSGIGFATTLTDIAPLLSRMQAGQVLQSGWLGVKTEPKFLGPGAKLAVVNDGGAAHAAGLLSGDVITEVDGSIVRNGPHLQMLVNSRLGGDTMTLKVQRAKDGAVETLAPCALRDAPWAEQKQATEAESGPAFPLPKPNEERGR